jgi:hypothetical protein
MDPRNDDPRRALADPAAREKLARAQAVARAQAAAARAVGFVAALAWIDAPTPLLHPTSESSLKNPQLPSELAVDVKARISTLIAVVAVVILNRVARRMVKRSAINAADAESTV